MNFDLKKKGKNIKNQERITYLSLFSADSSETPETKAYPDVVRVVSAV